MKRTGLSRIRKYERLEIPLSYLTTSTSPGSLSALLHFFNACSATHYDGPNIKLHNTISASLFTRIDWATYHSLPFNPISTSRCGLLVYIHNTTPLPCLTLIGSRRSPSVLLFPSYLLHPRSLLCSPYSAHFSHPLPSPIIPDLTSSCLQH